jgi:hypothetical protein
MEHIVNPRLGRKLQLVGDNIESLDHLVSPKVLRRQLGQGPVSNGLSGALVQTEPCPLTDFKFELAMLLVVCELHDPLRLKKPIAHLHKEDVPILELSIHRRHPCHARQHRKQSWRRPTVDNFEWCRLQRCLVRSVIAIFCPWKPLQPALGSIADQAAEVNRDNPVCDLRLPVGLRPEGRTGAQRRPTEAEKLSPHRAGEDGVPVADD